MLKARLAPALLLLLSACATTPEQPPARSHAWVSFDAENILAREAQGLADPVSKRPLTIDDPVRIASISKLVTAIGVMRLVDEGRLDLDRDVSDWLGWRLRNPAFPDDPITLRMLLSHQSSLKDDIDYAIPLGGSVRAALAAEEAFDPHHRPGTYFRYANLNFPVIATVMEAATGERFDLLMDRLVLAPLGIDACFNWPGCSDAAVARAAALHGADGTPLRDDLRGRHPDCPVVSAADGGCDWQGYRPGTNGALFSPQGGLRISARDLAVIGRLLLNKGRHDGRTILSEAAVAEMLRPHWRYNGANGETEGGFYCAYGLAVQILPNPQPGCSDDLFGDGRTMIGHAGDAYGLRSGLWIDQEAGRGAAYFATGVAEDAPRGGSAYRAIEEWLVRRSMPGGVNASAAERLCRTAVQPSMSDDTQVLDASAFEPPPEAVDFYSESLELLNRSGVPFLLSGTYALSCFTGIVRPTKDLDVFCKPSDAPRILAFFKSQGYEITIEDERWIGKVWKGDNFFDVIFNISSASIPITDDWFAEVYDAEVYGTVVRITPPTEFILSKLFLQTRYRYDGADVAHVILKQPQNIDWRRLLSAVELYWEVLLIQILNFRFIYPTERDLIPRWLFDELIERVKAQAELPSSGIRICRGRLLSPTDFVIDVSEWGFADVVGKGIDEKHERPKH